MLYRYNFGKISKRSIGSVEKLLSSLRITPEELDYVNSLSDAEKYRRQEVPKSDGTIRVVYSPEKTLRKIQRRINKTIFNQRGQKGGLIAWPSYLYGSIPNNSRSVIDSGNDISRDYVACASNHCGAKSLLKVDISNFFDNIHEERVRSVFEDLLKFPVPVSNVLTEICCLNGSVVQGALTSSYIASAVLFDVEEKTVRRLEYKKLMYTRLVDDITISSKSVDCDFSFALSIVEDMLIAKDLPINLDKTSVTRFSTNDLLVHGLRVNYKEPRLPSSEVSRIRSSVKHLELLAEDSLYRVSRDYRRSFDRCQGRVNKLGRLGHKQHKVLLDRILRIKPLPSKSDIKRAENLVDKLEELFLTRSGEYWYARLFHRAHGELNILQRTFSGVAKKLRERLKSIKPNYQSD